MIRNERRRVYAKRVLTPSTYQGPGKRVKPRSSENGTVEEEETFLDRGSLKNLDILKVERKEEQHKRLLAENQYVKLFDLDEQYPEGKWRRARKKGLLAKRRYAPPWNIPPGSDFSSVDMFTDYVDNFQDGVANSVASLDYSRAPMGPVDDIQKTLTVKSSEIDRVMSEGGRDKMDFWRTISEGINNYGDIGAAAAGILAGLWNSGTPLLAGGAMGMA